MKKSILLSAALFFNFFGCLFNAGIPDMHLFAQSYQWAFTISGTSNEGFSVMVDGSGNVYVTGKFAGTPDFDPGTGTANLTSVGSRDIFVAKYNSSGAYQWTFNIGSTNEDIGYSVAVDGSGNVYVTGYFQGTADFDPGTGTANLTSVGSADLFVAKYNSSGAYQWAFKVGSTNNDVGTSIAVDGSGNVYVTGYFQGTADFNPGTGTANLTSTGVEDIFVGKYNSSGAYQWAFKVGSTSGDFAESIAVDGSGNVYVTGGFDGIADFDPGTGTANLTSTGSFDIFVSRYNSSGAYQWAFRVGSTNADVGNSVAVDGSGNVNVTGKFAGTADFDPGTGTANLTSTGSSDIFVSQYNSSGAYQWALKVGNTSSDYGNSIAVDDSGKVYVTGVFAGTADFDPGTDTASMTSIGMWDIFVSQYNSSGTYQWAFKVGSTSNDIGHSVAVDGSGNVYVTGYFVGTADFDPGASTENLTSAGSYNIFVAKYGGIVTSVEPLYVIRQCSNEINIFPTLSANGYFIITGLWKKADIFVYDVMGKNVETRCTMSNQPSHQSKSSNEHSRIIDLSSLSDGIYIVRMQTEKEIFQKKVILQK